MQAIATISFNPKQLVKFLFSSHQCLLASNLVLECLGWNWQNSVKTFNVKFTQKTKFIYQSLSILIPISFANGRRSIQLLLSLSITIALPASRKFRQLFLSFRKLRGYPTSPISSFIKFNVLTVMLQNLQQQMKKKTPLCKNKSLSHCKLNFHWSSTNSYVTDCYPSYPWKLRRN